MTRQTVLSINFVSPFFEITISILDPLQNILEREEEIDLMMIMYAKLW